VYGRITVRGWPEKTRITVLLRESEDRASKKISGEVVISACRINRNTGKPIPTSYRKLGETSNQDLRIQVKNGFWQSPDWDYRYWADQGINGLVMELEGEQWYTSVYQLVRPEEHRKKVLVPTRISEPQIQTSVDDINPAIMKYAVAFTLLDQNGDPIAGKVPVQFGITNGMLESDPEFPGVCFDNVSIKGFGQKSEYKIFLPPKTPRILTFEGPKKSTSPTMKALTDLIFTGKPHPTDRTKMLYTVLWTVEGSNSQAFKQPTVFRSFGGNVQPITGDDKGVCREDNVEVTKTETYTVFIPGVTGENVRKSAELQGPAKSAPEEPEVLEVDLPRCANASGWFMVTVRIKKGDKQQPGRRFRLTSVEALTATGLDLTSLGQGNSFELPTGPDGSLTFLLTFWNPVKAEVVFSLPNGSPQPKLLVK